MNLIFWTITALDAVLFVVLLVAGLTAKGLNDGGREMSLFFFVLVPGIIIGGGVLLYVKSESSFWRVVALLIVGGPGLFLGIARVRSAMIDYQIRQNSNGSGYFSGRDAKAAGRAVVSRDTAALRIAAKRIDVNKPGERGMTLMELAVDQVWEGPPGTNGPTSLDVVRELIALGADPNAGLEIATKIKDPAVVTTLLDAGAKPGYAPDKDPVVFEWLGVTPIVNFTALLDHELDLNIKNRNGEPLIVVAGEADRWDLVLLLMARGADATIPDAHDTHLSDVVKSRMESTMSRPDEMKADIARVRAMLSGKPVPQASR